MAERSAHGYPPVPDRWIAPCGGGRTDLHCRRTVAVISLAAIVAPIASAAFITLDIGFHPAIDNVPGDGDFSTEQYLVGFLDRCVIVSSIVQHAAVTEGSGVHWSVEPGRSSGAGVEIRTGQVAGAEPVIVDLVDSSSPAWPGTVSWLSSSIDQVGAGMVWAHLTIDVHDDFVDLDASATLQGVELPVMPPLSEVEPRPAAEARAAPESAR